MPLMVTIQSWSSAMMQVYYIYYRCSQLVGHKLTDIYPFLFYAHKNLESAKVKSILKLSQNNKK